MAMCLNVVSTPVQWGVLKSGPRVFALLGKATPSGLAPFNWNEVSRNWAVTAEFGSLRLEQLTGEEEVLADRVVLPTPFSYDYGLAGPDQSPELIRAVFGLLPSELERVVTVLRQGSFPVLGLAAKDLACSLSGGTIPAYWPHVVVSNVALYGNIVSLETFLRVVVSSLPQGRLGVRFPTLLPVLKQMMKLILHARRGLPYCKEMLSLEAAPR